MKKLFTFLFGIPFLLHSQLFAAESKNADSLSILFIGNSYTHMNDMPSIFHKIAIAKGKKIHVEKNTQAGASFRVHTTRMDLFEKIRSRKWDYIVLQGYSRELSHPKERIDTATIPFINQIIDSIKLNNSCTNLLFYNTWGYKDGFAERPEIDSYEKMQDSIVTGYRYLSDYYNVPIVPVGMVWKYVREKYPDMDLYVEDHEHPNKIGSYLSACTFYTAIFNESPEGAITSTISSKNALVVQRAAAHVVLENYKTYKLDMNTSSVKYIRTKNVKYIATCKANFPKAVSITWDFGDGKSSTEANATHEYAKPGLYTVKLLVEEECGIRTINRKIRFEAPKKPKKPKNSKPKKDSTAKKKI